MTLTSKFCSGQAKFLKYRTKVRQKFPSILIDKEIRSGKYFFGLAKFGKCLTRYRQRFSTFGKIDYVLQFIYNMLRRCYQGKEEVVMVVILLQLDLQLPVQLVPFTTIVVSSNPAHGDVYSIQHYVIKFVSDPWLVCGSLRVPGFLHQ